MLAVIKRCGCYLFLSATRRISTQRMVCAAQFSRYSAKLYFFDSYGPCSPKMNSADYSTRFLESYNIINMIYKPAILKKSSNKWLNSGKPLTQCPMWAGERNAPLIRFLILALYFVC